MRLIHKITNSMKVSKMDFAKMMATMNGSVSDYIALTKLDVEQ